MEGRDTLSRPPSVNNRSLIPDFSYYKQQPRPWLTLLLEWLKLS